MKERVLLLIVDYTKAIMIGVVINIFVLGWFNDNHDITHCASSIEIIEAGTLEKELGILHEPCMVGLRHA